MKLETRAVHRRLGSCSHVPAIDLSTAYRFDCLSEADRSMGALLEGSPVFENPVYARLHNPTVAVFEQALADLEGAESAVAFASGMAAVCALITMRAMEGRHIVAVRPVYGGTDHVLSEGWLGTEVTWARADRVAQALRSDTSLVFIETPANPTLKLVSIADIVRQAGSVPVAVDSTFATPVLQRPLEHGAAFVVHSATKFLGGHGDVLGGVVACADRWARGLRQVRMGTGGILHPLAGYLLHRGLQTLPVRVKAQQETARSLAQRLAGHPAVLRVHYPGLATDRAQARIRDAQMDGPGSMLSFRLHGGARVARRFIEALELLTPAVSLGAVDTLVQIPALLTHRVVDEEQREGAGIPPDLVRLSVGLEAEVDLWRDLSQAIDHATRRAA
jgi:methionine-gamma-lyase